MRMRLQNSKDPADRQKVVSRRVSAGLKCRNQTWILRESGTNQHVWCLTETHLVAEEQQLKEQRAGSIQILLQQRLEVAQAGGRLTISFKTVKM